MPLSRGGRLWYDEVADFVALGMSLRGAHHNVARGHALDMGPGDAVWRPVPDAPGYEASACGLVRSVRCRRGARLGVLAARPHADGYVRLRLAVAGRTRAVYAHVVVARTFLGPPPSPRHVVGHRNGRRADNRAANLAWLDPAAALAPARAALRTRAPRGAAKRNAKLSDAAVRSILASAAPAAALAARYGVARPTIVNLRAGRGWKHLTCPAPAPDPTRSDP